MVPSKRSDDRMRRFGAFPPTFHSLRLDHTSETTMRETGRAVRWRESWWVPRRTFWICNHDKIAHWRCFAGCWKCRSESGLEMWIREQSQKWIEDTWFKFLRERIYDDQSLQKPADGDIGRQTSLCMTWWVMYSQQRFWIRDVVLMIWEFQFLSPILLPYVSVSWCFFCALG